MRYILAILLLASCVLVKATPVEKAVQTEDLIPRFYSFALDEPGGYLFSKGYGHAFIADYKVWTASHCVNLNTEPDIIELGAAPIRGFLICQFPHSKNDVLSYRTARGLHKLLIIDSCDYFYTCLSINEIRQGDSGSPVLCSHNKVVGCVSKLFGYINVTDGGPGAHVARIPTSDSETAQLYQQTKAQDYQFE